MWERKMESSNYKALLKDYNNYSHSDEAVVVYIVRNYVDKLETKSKWIDVIDFDAWAINREWGNNREWESNEKKKKSFNYFVIELFKREINPIYPNEKEYSENQKDNYIRICKALTWEASHTDIDQQREKGKRGPMYLVICPVRNKNRGKKFKKAFPFWNEEYGGFDYTGNAPTTTIYKYVDMEPDWDYVLIGLTEINDQKFNMIKENYDEFIRPRIINEKRILIDWFLEDYQLAKSKPRKPEEKRKIKPNTNKTILSKKNSSDSRLK